jgi:Reverse transcriptase (RNA-dependent DNA polymerase)
MWIIAGFAGDVDTRISTTDYVVQEENGIMKERHSLIALYVDDLLIACSNKKMCGDLEKDYQLLKIMGSVNHILGMDVRNSVDIQSVHLLQTQYITKVYNNCQQHGVYCYGTPLNSDAQLSKPQCPTEGFAEPLQIKNMSY